ncbi:hypothetical protein [Caballeronia sordidicola]|uniref:Uncharacterized protein n=1 Tax=Caballeronia sordidicola TaxID=196367 RepID=A0A242MPY7_CABSO|nr:hypothetical protein [Caballeronia sordidicola]OTP73386.1 hypothetical protein PAMC26510_19115 [Caballeronia sordidicola]
MDKLYAAATFGQATGSRHAGDHRGCAEGAALAGAMVMSGGVVSVGTPL